MSITGSLPFNGTTDQNLSVAYIAALVLVLLVSSLKRLASFSSHRSHPVVDYIISGRRVPLCRDGLHGAGY